MNLTRHRATAAALLPSAFLSFWLAACGGGDEPPALSAATLTAAADSATVPWNAAAAIDVLANDKVSRSALKLTAATGALHGTTSVVGGRLNYVPTAGYFGTDSVTYTAQADEGGATATAIVSISVQAKIRLKGVVADAPVANASVTATVGAVDHTVTAAADGSYGLDITTSNPQDFVTLAARGAGAQAAVKLVSLVGEAARLAALVSANGELDSAQLPALNVTHLSTAMTVLVIEANGGAPPTTQARVDELSATVGMDRLLDLATVITLVADHGVPLPEGVADTLALVSSPGSSLVLAAFLTEQAYGTNEGNFRTRRDDVMSALALAGQPAVAANGAQTFAYFVGHKLSGQGGSLVTYRPDGTATVVRYNGTREAAWEVSNGALTLALALPFSSEYLSADIDPRTGYQTRLRDDMTGFVLRQVTGGAVGGAVLVHDAGNTVTLDGPDAGKSVPFDASYSSMLKGLDIDRAPPLTQADMSTGTLWAGPFGDAFPDSGFLNSDVLEITGAGTARFARAGTAKTWALSGGKLTVSDAGGERRYVRVSRDAVSGEEHWIVADVVSGVVTRAEELLVVKADAAGRFQADASLYRRWASGINSGSVTQSLRSYFDVYADGSSAQVSVRPGELDSAIPSRWSLDADGSLVMTRLDGVGEVISVRTWRVLKRSAGQMIVMEHLEVAGQPPLRRVNVYADTGAAVKL